MVKATSLKAKQPQQTVGRDDGVAAQAVFFPPLQRVAEATLLHLLEMQWRIAQNVSQQHEASFWVFTNHLPASPIAGVTKLSMGFPLPGVVSSVHALQGTASAPTKGVEASILVSPALCWALVWTPEARKRAGHNDVRLSWTTQPVEVAAHLQHWQTTLEQSSEGCSKQQAQALLDARTWLETSVAQTTTAAEHQTLWIASVVEGLESQHEALTTALEQVQQLQQQVVNHERLAAIGQLCSVVAHEIRNPLGLIDLYASLLEGQVGTLLAEQTDVGTLTEQAQQRQTLISDQVQMIRQAIGQLDGILGELTQYSRPLTLELEPVEITPWVQRVCDFIRPSYLEKDVALVMEPTSVQDITLAVDSRRLQQALFNLLKNALEACKAGGEVRVRVDSRTHDDKVYIKVRDTGSGITAQSQQKLFTPYFSTKGNGTGLGLAHSRKIVQTHGGDVLILATQADASAGPTGTTMAIVLPRTP